MSDVPKIVDGLMRHRLNLLSDEEFKSAEEAENRVQRERHTAELRAKWNAPKRHVTVMALDRSGPWGDAETKLKSKLGHGFLVALIGGRGGGKTQLAIELMRESTRRQGSALYATAAEFFMAIKATYRKDSTENEMEVIARFTKPSILVLDEFGRRSETDWESNLLFELLDKRYGKMKNTILLSNQTKEEFLSSVGASLASRMQETGGVMECNWPSRREGEQEQNTK